VAWEVAIRPFLPSIWSNLNLSLIVLIIIGFVYSVELATVNALFFGFLFDLYSVLPFGTILLTYGLTFFLLNRLFYKFLTNKSLYSFIGMTGLVTLLFSSWQYCYLIIHFFYNKKEDILWTEFSRQFAVGFLWQLGLNCLFGLFFFVLLNYFSRRFKAVYIDTIKN